MTETRPLLLIDLGSLAFPIHMMGGSDPQNPDATSQGIVAKVRSLIADYPHAAVCADSGKCFRHDVDATYKAQRAERDAVLQHQIGLAIEAIKADGIPVWSAKGFEADDVVASATLAALQQNWTVRIVSADKDLLALVDDRVVAQSLKDGATIDAAAVEAKFGVRPQQMTDYLCLVGDASDNVKGAKGIGETKARALLARFGSLDVLFDQAAALAWNQIDLQLQPAVVAALREFEPRYPTVRTLIKLRTDVPVPLEEAFAPRVPAEGIPQFDEAENDMNDEQDDTALAPVGPPAEEPASLVHQPSSNGHAIARRPEVLPVAFEMEFEPRTSLEAKRVATDMYNSRLFLAYGSPPAVLAIMMAGRELGLPTMRALRAFHVIEGKTTLPADLLRALVIQSGKAQYFRCTERTNERATFETKRGDDPPIALTFTVEDAKVAWPKTRPDWEKAFLASGWTRNPADMCVARASSKLARLVYSDVIHGLYAYEEMQDD